MQTQYQEKPTRDVAKRSIFTWLFNLRVVMAHVEGLGLSGSERSIQACALVDALHFLSRVSLSVILNLSFSSADGSVAARPNQPRPRSSLNFHSISDRPVALVAREISVTGELV